MEADVLTPESAQAPAVKPKRASRVLPERRAAVWVTRKFEAPPERVFDAWLDPALASRWLFATASRPMTRATIDARVGGAFRLVERKDGGHVEHSGIYVEIDRPWRLVFTLSLGEEPRSRTRVVTEIVPRGGGCELTLAHENVPSEYLTRSENRWTGMLYGLGEILDA